MKAVTFYRIDEKYIEYLKNYEIQRRGFTRVPNIKYKARDKFTFGTVLCIEGFNYYVSVSSFKIKQEANILIKAQGDRDIVKGSLRFNYMFPVPENCLRELIINEETDEEYKILLHKEYRFCIDNLQTIQTKAKNIYEKVINNRSQKLTDNSCDFKLLEEACKTYKSD